MAHPVADLFHKAARLNRQEEHRHGHVVRFRTGERLVVCGDIHGHRQNLTKVIAHADLPAAETRMLVLQELIHGGPLDDQGGDRSVEVLMRAARLKTQFPRQVHFLLGNHDLAQFTGNEITKEGQGVCKSFDLGLQHAFGADWSEVADAIDEFLRSMPLAARCPNGAFLSHSLPSPDRVGLFDPAVLDRPWQEADLKRGGAVYELVWGRRQNPETLEAMAALLQAEVFITGHQPIDEGFLVDGRQLILASEHARGTIAEFTADAELTPQTLGRCVRAIAKL